ncbi:hypothetical protein HZY86_01935 [Aerococcaceae bacterium DSM 111020]|nr:hypothetical protein [Aerococcaceae bacterium DSM 111020]
MPLLEMGAIATAIMAIYATMAKTVNLIKSIGELIQRIDQVYEESEHNKTVREQLEEQTAQHATQLFQIECTLHDIKDSLTELKQLAAATAY